MKTMNDFYTFDSKGYLTTFSARADIFDEALRCEERYKAGIVMDDLIKGQYEGYTFPLIFHPGERGTKLRDVLDTRYPPAYLISDRLKSLLEENQITGWSAYTIELYDRKGNLIPGYHGFSIIGRAGIMDWSNQPIVEKPTGVSGNLVKYYQGGYFDIATWDGSDFFLLKDSYWIIVTKRVVDLLKKNKIQAVEFTNLPNLDIFY